MDKTKVIQQARDLASDAKQEEALELLLRFFTGEERYKHLERKTRQVLAQYKRTERDAMLGVKDMESTQLAYNRITQNVLQLTDYLEAGELRPGQLTGEEKPKQWGTTALLILVLVLLGGVAWWFLSNDRETDPAPAAQQSPCPEYPQDESFRILLFPFRELNANSLRPHLAIGDRLGNLKEQYGIGCGIRYYDIDTKDLNLYPSTSTDASNLGKQCSAQLVIWGSTEQTARSAIIQTRYRFIDQNKLPLHKLTVTGSSQIDTVTTLSSIATEGTITANIENSIKLLFGLIAHSSGNEPVAQKMLEQSSGIEDSSAALTRDLVLADIYLNQQNKDMATARYDSVLSRHPDEQLALNNRGLLYYENGQFTEAAADLSQVIEKEEQAEQQLLKIRADAYLKSDQFHNARKDLQQLKSIGEAPEVSRKLDEVNRKIEQEEQTKARADAQLQVNPDNLSALKARAASSWKLGDYQTTISSAETMIGRDPKNVEAYAELIKAYRAQSETKQVQQVYEQAKRAGVDLKKLNKLVSPPVRYIRRQ